MPQASSSASPRPVRVWIISWQAGANTTRPLARLLAALPNASELPPIEWRQVSWNSAWSELASGLASDTGPDVVQIGTSWVGTLAHLGHLSPVPAGVVDRPALAPWIDEVVRYAGTTYAAPWELDSNCLLARADVLERFGLTARDLADWEGFAAACELIGAASDAPSPLGLTCRRTQATVHQIVPWLWAGGWPNLDLRSTPLRALSSPTAEPGLRYLSRLLAVGKNPQSLADIHPSRLEDAFHEDGEYAFLLGWLHSMRDITNPAATSRFPIVVLPLPAGPHGSVPFGGGSVLAVSSRCTDPDAAWSVVHALLDEEVQSEWVAVSGAPPSLDGSFWRTYAAIPEVALLHQTAQTARAYPVHPLWRSAEIVLGQGLGDLLWSLASGATFDQAIPAARRTDDRLNELVAMTWDLS